MNEVEKKIRDIFERISGIQGIEGKKPFDDCEVWDSLRHAEFIIKLQETFSVRFAVHEMICFKCLDQVVTCVSKQMGQGKGK